LHTPVMGVAVQAVPLHVHQEPSPDAT
jgi:hypothetical protein